MNNSTVFQYTSEPDETIGDIFPYKAPGITHIRLTRQLNGILAEFGHVTWDKAEFGYPVQRFQAFHTETYLYKDAPELYELWDGAGWNALNVYAFIHNVCDAIE